MRKAIALIELIFAMVVIAITLISVPNLISKTSTASNKAIEQEALSNVASYIDMIMSSYWDEESVEPKRGNPILVVEKEDNALKEINQTLAGVVIKLGKRVGSPKESSRVFIDNSGSRYNATKADKLGFELNETEPDDIDDFNNRVIQLTKTTQTTTPKIGDYKDKKVQISTSIKYIKDLSTPQGYNKSIIKFDNPFNNIETQSTNIKAITVTLTSKNDKNKKIVLKAFSCNIGSSKLKEKQF